MFSMAKGFETIYSGFRGIDQRAGCSVDMNAMPELINFLITENGCLKKRPGIVTVDSFSKNSSFGAMWSGLIDGVETTLVAHGMAVYKYINGIRTELGGTTGNVSQFIQFNDKVYTLGCSNLYVIDSDGMSVADAYIPIVVTGASPDGAGTVYEQPNRLTYQRRVQYCPDGTSKVFRIPEKSVFSIDKVTLNGTVVNNSFFVKNSIDRTVTFNIAPAVGINSLEITYSMSSPAGWRGLIACKYGVVFENRLFIYGEPEKGNILYHSSLADGISNCCYFAESDYHCFSEEIMGLTPCYNRLLIYFKNSAKFTFAELFTDNVGNTRTTFPIFELNGSKGTIQPGCCELMQNTPVTVCADGLNRWVSTYIADERSAEPFSQRMFRYFSSLISSKKQIVICNRKNASELWVSGANGIAIYNYRLDCFYYYYDLNIVGLCEEGQNMLIAHKNGVLSRLTEGESFDDGQRILAIARFPFCTFGTPFMLKSLSHISVDVEGEKAFEAKIMLDRGNRTYTETVDLKLSASHGAALRRIRLRCPLKRFYSCHAVLETYSEDACLNAIGFEGSYLSGGIRVH